MAIAEAESEGSDASEEHVSSKSAIKNIDITTFNTYYNETLLESVNYGIKWCGYSTSKDSIFSSSLTTLLASSKSDNKGLFAYNTCTSACK